MNFPLFYVFVIILATYVVSRPVIDPKKALITISEDDKHEVLDCFLVNRVADNRSCYLLEHSAIDNMKHREVVAMHYYYMLVDASNQINRCLHYERNMLPVPQECSYLGDTDLVEHCFLHHQHQQYKPCEGISYPRIAIPSDVRTLFRYLTWRNISSEWHQAHSVPMNSNNLRAIVNGCLHSNSWEFSICPAIANPDANQTYPDRITRMQVAYKQLQLANRKRDCEFFHEDELKNGVGDCANESLSFAHALDENSIYLQLFAEKPSQELSESELLRLD